MTIDLTNSEFINMMHGATGRRKSVSFDNAGSSPIKAGDALKIINDPRVSKFV
jgi:hypothetical protein